MAFPPPRPKTPPPCYMSAEAILAEIKEFIKYMQGADSDTKQQIVRVLDTLREAFRNAIQQPRGL